MATELKYVGNTSSITELPIAGYYFTQKACKFKQEYLFSGNLQNPNYAYENKVKHYADYYPFESIIASRSYSSGAYRFGFNGKEKDNETLEGALAFEARIFDSRLGRFLSLDIRMGEYPWQTPYAYFSNSPISVIDYLGMGAPPATGNTSQGCARGQDPNACQPSAANSSGSTGAQGNVGAAQDSSPGWHAPMVVPAILAISNSASNTQSSSNQGTAAPTQPAPSGGVNQNGQTENPEWSYVANFCGPHQEGTMKMGKMHVYVFVTAITTGTGYVYDHLAGKFDGTAYEVPIYELQIFGLDGDGNLLKEKFNCFRFGKSTGVDVGVGISTTQLYTAQNYDATYNSHSNQNAESGAFQVTSNYLIHCGVYLPCDPCNENGNGICNSLGCMSIHGEGQWDFFRRTVITYYGNGNFPTNSILDEKSNILAKSGYLYVQYNNCPNSKLKKVILPCTTAD